jgi:hypothetical protein
MRALVTLIALAVPAVATAQPADKSDAQSLMQSGVKLLEAKDYLGALAVFTSAYERFPSARILLNIGTTLKLLGRDADAANVYQRYLDADDADPKRIAGIKKILGDIDKTVARLEIRVTPDLAEVQVGDGDWLPAAQVTLYRVAPGNVEVHARKDGHAASSSAVRAAPGAAVAVTLELLEIPDDAEPIVADHEDRSSSIEARREAGPRARFGAFALGHLDMSTLFDRERPAGGAAVVGFTADVTERAAARAGAILGPAFGGYVAGTFAFLPGRYRPYGAAGVLMFVSSGARFAVRGAAGFEWLISRHVSVLAELGVERNLNAEMGRDVTLFVPAIGAAGRL